MKRLLILLVLITGTVQAEIYKSQNENGEWIYSDKPSPRAEPMKLPPLSTYAPSTPSSHFTSTPKQESEDVYKSMVFVEPENNATIRSNEGVVDVSVRIEPLLKSQQGHKIQFYVDETPYGAPGAGLKLTLKNVERGSHVLSARVLNTEGELVYSAGSVTFHVHKQSVNQPNRVTPPPLPKPQPLPKSQPLSTAK
jgi:hypothetical protein